MPVKIIVAGGFGVGKTTTVGAISEIAPLTTEAEMTDGVGRRRRSRPGVRQDHHHVAMDFGCVTIDRTLKLYLFGTPGQSRFAFMWDDLVRGALGALVVVDTGRIDDCYSGGGLLRTGRPPVRGRRQHLRRPARARPRRGPLGARRRRRVPVVPFDARQRLSVRDALLVVLDQALDRAMRERGS